MACDAAFDRFAADGALSLVAVVDGDRPVGLLTRSRLMQSFAERGAHARLYERPVSALMDRTPMVVDVGEDLAAVHARIVDTHPDALIDGFVIVEGGRYAGIGTAIDLLRLTVMQMAGDRAELEASRGRAERSSDTKSQFLANMSHELRTPLNAIIGFSEIIRDQTFGPVGSTKYRDYARDIHVSGQHLLALVNDILDLSKVEAGAIELYEERVSLADLVAAALTLVSQPAASADVRLEIDLPQVLPRLLVDPRKIKQVLVNLLSNAVKFTPEGGTVRLAVVAGDGLDITVTDTGIGMAPDEIPHALTPFKRLDSKVNRAKQGTGLGLPLSKALIEAHDGTLTLVSARGRGTTATVNLPAARLAWPPVALVERAS